MTACWPAGCRPRPALASAATSAFYDDGVHGDDLPGDGIFGSDAFAPPGSGVAYLWLRGTLDGETITRSDPAPFNFQPIDVSPETPYVQGFLGSPVAVGFAVTNQTTETLLRLGDQRADRLDL